MPLLACGQKLVQTVKKIRKVGSFAAPILVVVFWLPKWESNLSQEEIKGNCGRLHLVAVSGLPIW